MQKLSISMPPDLLQQVREAVREDGVSLSAAMAEGAKEWLRMRAWRISIEEYQAEYGPFTAEELAAAAAHRPVTVGPVDPEEDT
jgi:metal-responsive CopG/Arc/MetJ family transcriptional regulator